MVSICHFSITSTDYMQFWQMISLSEHFVLALLPISCHYSSSRLRLFTQNENTTYHLFYQIVRVFLSSYLYDYVGGSFIDLSLHCYILVTYFCLPSFLADSIILSLYSFLAFRKHICHYYFHFWDIFNK